MLIYKFTSRVDFSFINCYSPEMKKDVSFNYPRILIAGTHSGAGKTTITLGLLSALKEKGYSVQGFKAGPDYIDPSHHTAITGRFSRNLDTWLMSRDVCLELFEHAVGDSDIAIIEGVMGLFDGCLSGTEIGSSAYLSKILNVPVILVIDAKGMSRSAGAVALGFKKFDKEIVIHGIILNRVGSERHYNSLKKSIEDNSGIPVIGYLPKDDEIKLPERHLGLVPSIEQEFSKTVYQKIGDTMSKTVDIKKLVDIAFAANRLPSFQKTIYSGIAEQYPLRIAVAIDEAFNFYYHDNLDLLEACGVELAYFSPLYDKYVPADVSAVYIGGGFPELHAPLLSSNTTMKESLRKAYKNGVVFYGECGGMMYLLEHMASFNNNSYEMCGIFKGGTRMEQKRQGLGYITVRGLHDNLLCKKEDVFKAHEFHWSSLQHIPENTCYAYEVIKGDTDKPRPEGFFTSRALCSYVHVHFASDIRLLRNFLESVKIASS
ncbi:MAG: cobyrinate a,c-diamide synthase [Candidatus Kuenenia sp.]|nr:cobyrinate a,c-diamide synthase [Candidatus Kuenenia hertensis]